MSNYSQLEFCQVEEVRVVTPKKIHIIHCPEQKAFKVIGSSRDITKCLSELQKGNPITLTCYVSFHGTNDTKWTILDDCKEFSLHGDWLQDNESVRAYLNSQLNILVN